MNYRIERVELGSPWQNHIAEVVSEAFESSDPEETFRDLRLTTETHGKRKSAYFAAIEGDQLIGFNAFIAHDLSYRGTPVQAFQSCWTATSSAHRGKKVFQNIILHAHEELSAAGADFIIGWPNPSSEPIFCYKLNYKREESVKRNVPGLFAERFFGLAEPGASGIQQNDKQLIELKAHRYGENIFVVQQDDGILWGLLRHRGQVPYFALGGIHWTRENGARSLARMMRKKLPFVAYWQIVSEARNSLNPAIGAFSISTTNPFIWFRLSESAPDASFDFFAGIRDVY